jgi:hypothetical protein
MEDAVRSQQIESIKIQLTSCEREAAALAREALGSATSEARRVEALIVRAGIQTRIACLVHDLERLQPGCVETDPVCARKPELNNPWPRPA